MINEIKIEKEMKMLLSYYWQFFHSNNFISNKTWMLF